MGRTLAIGDIHGCARALATLVEAVSPAADDTIVTLGDYVDRGPDSRAVVDILIELDKTHRLVPLRGNHEIMMLDARTKKSWFGPWKQYGGDATLESYGGSFDDVPEAHIDFLENRLIRNHETETHLFAHANIDEDEPLDGQSDAASYWRHYRRPVRHCSDKILVCGHTPQKTGLPSASSHSICIDTWAHGGGWLSCLDVDSGTVWQANQDGESRSFALD